MRFVKTGLPVIFLIAVTGCASKSELDYLRNDVASMSTRFSSMEKDLGKLKSETQEDLEKNIHILQQNTANIRKEAADLQANIEVVKVDMQALSGKLDDLAQAAKKPSDDMSLLKEDTERRLTAIEGRLTKLEQALAAQQQAAEAKAAEVEKNPETLYQKGLDTFKSGDMKKARELFTKFIQLNPTHDLAANAHYWLGETYFNEKNYDQAILEFQDVIKNFPKKEKVPAALLKQAMAFKELGDLKSSRYLLKKVIDEFPASEEAKTAREKLKALR
jgi:tol-pal system protein YbgF